MQQRPIAANGADPKEALEAFRQRFTNVLRDFASEAGSFSEFEAARPGLLSFGEHSERGGLAPRG